MMKDERGEIYMTTSETGKIGKGDRQIKVSE